MILHIIMFSFIVEVIHKFSKVGYIIIYNEEIIKITFQTVIIWYNKISMFTKEQAII